MDSGSSKHSYSLHSSPFSSPKVSALLKIKILSWYVLSIVKNILYTTYLNVSDADCDIC